MAAGRFREDLLARIHLWTFALPALAQKKCLLRLLVDAGPAAIRLDADSLAELDPFDRVQLAYEAFLICGGEVEDAVVTESEDGTSVDDVAETGGVFGSRFPRCGSDVRLIVRVFPRWVRA